MGLCNALATHQRRMYKVLRPLIGKICHIYLDNIIIWSNSIQEHWANIHKVMTALWDVHLYCSSKKTSLFLEEVSFLGHVISHNSVKPDLAKVSSICDWPRPKSTKNVRSFLGLILYVSSFLPHLAEHTAILTPLTSKEWDNNFPEWSDAHEQVFKKIKRLVCLAGVLGTIQVDSPGTIFVTTDASNLRTGAMLSIGKIWETSWLVAFDSMQLNRAQHNYPVHEKELLAIVRALDKWRYHLLGMHFKVYTDHRTLQYFQSQPSLSR